MNDTYIKHPSGNYCYFSHERIDLNYLCFIDYFIKNGVITDEKIKTSYLKIKSMCKSKTFSFSYLDYRLYEQKSIHDMSDSYSLDAIKQSYLNLVAVHQISEELIGVLTGLKKEIKAIANRDFAEYIPSKESYLNDRKYYLGNKFEREYIKLHSGSYSQRRSYVNQKTEEALETIKREYNRQSVTTSYPYLQKALKLNLEKLVLHWEEVLDEHGDAIELEGNNAIDHFQHAITYAIFCESYDKTGYWNQKSRYLTSIRDATLFATKKDAQAQMKRYNVNGVIAEVNVNFIQIVDYFGQKIDLTHLDTVSANQEKIHLETQENAQTLATRLLEHVQGNDNLVFELQQLLQKSQEKGEKKKNKKI
jgi:hypothetical protein